MATGVVGAWSYDEHSHNSRPRLVDTFYLFGMRDLLRHDLSRGWCPECGICKPRVNRQVLNRKAKRDNERQAHCVSTQVVLKG
jgi:hypothetical protein